MYKYYTVYNDTVGQILRKHYVVWRTKKGWLKTKQCVPELERSLNLSTIRQSINVWISVQFRLRLFDA